jgi:flagellar protein FlbD
MIKLTSINGKEFYLNCDLIYKVQESFDTIITLIDGKNIRVMDSPDDIVAKIIEYKRCIYNNIGGEI